MFRYPFLDFDALNNEINQNKIESHSKLRYIHEHLGGSFYDAEKRIMTGASVAVVSIGGFPVELDQNGLKLMGAPISTEHVEGQFLKSVGMSAFMSYLNPKNKTLGEIATSTLSLEHYSVLHMINVSILLSGITVGVEHEFSSQRDIVHLSRLTVAKTKSQSAPCLVLNNEKYYQAYKTILHATETALCDMDDPDHETRNLLFPSAKASAVILTGSLKDIMKLIALKEAGGKEAEFVSALTLIQDVVGCAFPSLFYK